MNTRLTVVLWALLQSPTLGVFCLGQTDLLVAEVEGLLAPVPMQLQDGNEVPDGSEDGEAQDRVNMDPWVLPCAVGEALVLQCRGQWRWTSPELHRSLTKEVSVARVSPDTGFSLDTSSCSKCEVWMRRLCSTRKNPPSLSLLYYNSSINSNWNCI